MKRVIIFVILSIEFCSLIFSQQNDFKLDSLLLFNKANDSISKYYKHVYKAEKYIMKGDFKKAAEIYEKAFTYIEIPFMADLGHAIKCEMDSRKDEGCIKKYIYFLIRKTGLKNGYLTNKEYQKLETWPEIKEMIDTLTSLNDTTIINGLERIHFLDQDYRKQCNKKYNGNTYNDFTRDSIAKIDSINYYQIYRMFENLEYVSEEVIGYRGWGTVNVVLMHNRQRKLIYELLLKSVLAGKLDARLFCKSLDDSNYKFENKYSVGGAALGFRVTDDCYMYMKPKFIEGFKMNKYREKLYVESISDFHEKMIWQMRNKDSGFLFYINVIINLDETSLCNLIANGIFNNHKIKNAKLYYSSEDNKETLESNAEKWAAEQNKL